MTSSSPLGFAVAWSGESQPTNCSLCSQLFSLFSRRHTCRSCGLTICSSCSRSKRILPGTDDKSPARICDKCEAAIGLEERGVDPELITCFILHQCSLESELPVLKRYLMDCISTYEFQKNENVFVYLHVDSGNISVQIAQLNSFEGHHEKWKRDLHGLRRNGGIFHVLESVADSKIWMKRIFAVTNNGDLALSNIDAKAHSDLEAKDLAVRFIRPISQVRSLSLKRVLLAEKTKILEEVWGRAVSIKWRDDPTNPRKDTVLVLPGKSETSMEKTQKDLLETVRLHVDVYQDRKLSRISDLTQKKAQMSIPVNWQMPEHESLFRRLWAALKPEIEFPGSKSDQWKDIGFQGKDPQTDFRGTGFLGLICVVYWAETLGDIAREMVQNTRHYPVCTAAINIVSMLDDLIGPLPSSANESGSGGGELFIALCHPDAPHRDAFEQVFCSLIMRFDRTFLAANATYMDFPRIRQKFLQEVNALLNKHPFSYSTLHRWLADV